jgi:tetratricopeptide (TPR) repeat protein
MNTNNNNNVEEDEELQDNNNSNKPIPAPSATTTILEKVNEIDSEELAKKRDDYYSKWRSLAKDETKKTKEEEELDKKKATEALGIDKGPKSEAEQKDLEKRAALREAKKLWEGKNAKDQAQRMVISDEKNTTRILKMADVEHRPVLIINNAKDCEYELSEELKSIIKVFIDNCVNTKIIVKCAIITQHLEISHSKKCEVVIAIPTQTLQIDLCTDIKLLFNQNCLLPGQRIYHAGVSNLEVVNWEHDMLTHNFEDFTVPEYDLDQTMSRKEWQYITHLVNDKLKTERVRHAHGIMPLTQGELNKLVTSDSEIEEARLRSAMEKKTGGSEAFKGGDFYQAAIYYTQAMDLAPGNIELLCTCLSNRAACNLKLGRLEEALDDANACLELDDKYTKAWFRKGMALHAMKNYAPAIESLAKAAQLEPKNKQIAEALGFAKVMLNKKLREEEEARS